MAEYIDREALLKTIFPYDVADKSKYTINAKAIEKAIKGATTADVVEVVRCKHCDWWEARSCGSFIGKCQNPRNGLVSEYTDDTDFCSYGEMKEQGKEDENEQRGL